MILVGEAAPCVFNEDVSRVFKSMELVGYALGMQSVADQAQLWRLYTLVTLQTRRLQTHQIYVMNLTCALF